MNMKNIFGALAVMACMTPASCVLAQAGIVENEPSSIYVSAAAGSDINPGTVAKPTQTIQAALNKALTASQSGVGTKIIIAPGTYRETLTVNSSGTAPVTLQASITGATIVDGADLLTGWAKTSTNVYTHSWTDTVKGCPLPSGWYTGMPPVVIANEMLFVNGAMMTQVMSASQLRPGTFYVASSQVQVDPPSGTNMSTAKVEVSARRSTLAISHGHNLVFRGLVFQHAAACMNQTGATVNSSSGVLFDSDTANWNNWGGLGVNNSTGVTVENTTASYNGGPGLEGFEDVGSVWQNNETDYNNWRGNMIGLYDFAQGGTKLMRAHTATVSGQVSYNNASQGLWFDTDNMNITISGARLVGNLVGNLQMEANEGPFTVTGSTFCNGGGIQMINTAGITMTGNHIYNNGGQSFQNAQLFLAGNPGGRIVKNWQTGASTNVFTKNLKLQSNQIVAVGSSENIFNTYVSGTSWTEFITTVSASGNVYYDAAKSNAFVLSGNKSTNLAGWKSATHSDGSAVWKTYAVSCGVPSPAYPDFQLLAHNAASYVSGYSMSGGHLTIPLQIRSFNYGTVSLSVSGLPSGVSGSFSTSSLVSGSSSLTLKASSSTKSQTALVTIFGVSGNRVHSITLKVAVKPS